MFTFKVLQSLVKGNGENIGNPQVILKDGGLQDALNALHMLVRGLEYDELESELYNLAASSMKEGKSFGVFYGQKVSRDDFSIQFHYAVIVRH